MSYWILIVLACIIGQLDNMSKEDDMNKKYVPSARSNLKSVMTGVISI